MSQTNDQIPTEYEAISATRVRSIPAQNVTCRSTELVRYAGISADRAPFCIDHNHSAERAVGLNPDLLAVCNPSLPCSTNAVSAGDVPTYDIGIGTDEPSWHLEFRSRAISLRRMVVGRQSRPYSLVPGRR